MYSEEPIIGPLRVEYRSQVNNRNYAYTAVEPKQPEKPNSVYQVIRQMPNSTATEISETLHRPINEVVSRINELCNSFLIAVTGGRTNPETLLLNTTYTCTTPSERIDMINQEYARLTDAKKQLEHDYLSGLSNLTKGLILREKRKYDEQIGRLEKLMPKALF